MQENMKLQLENMILKVENMISKNIIMEMKIKQYLAKSKKYINN